jgi:hypothetical protein
MSVKVGFAILSHNAPERLLRLTKTLTTMFDGAPIVCHHDFTQCSLDETLLTKNVRFVHPHINTQWGHITTSIAALKAFALLRHLDAHDWFVLLSGSDYPVRPATELVSELSITPYDAYLDHRELFDGTLSRDEEQISGFDDPDWVTYAYGQYCTFRLGWIPFPSRQRLLSGLFPFRKRLVVLRNQSINRLIRVFILNQPSRIYGGDSWFHAGQRAIDRLLDEATIQKLVRYYRNRNVPEESYFHTALANQVDLKICRANKRYANWKAGGSHPKWLDESDLTDIIGSGAYFARKFQDINVLRLIETTLLGLTRQHASRK